MSELATPTDRVWRIFKPYKRLQSNDTDVLN